MSLTDLIERVEACEPSFALDEFCAGHLGWHQRRVTFLGLNGRTPGSDRWFVYPGDNPPKGRARPPHFTGPRRRAATLEALKALQAKEPTDG